MFLLQKIKHETRERLEAKADGAPLGKKIIGLSGGQINGP